MIPARFSPVPPRAPRLVLAIITLLLLHTSGLPAVAANPFPSYRVIAANVAFWENVFATWSVNTAVIHDQNDLSRVYATITLKEQDLPGAARYNERKIERVKKHIGSVLLKLAQDPRPTTREEKRLAAQFGTALNSAELKKAAANIRAQTGLKERFRAGVVRSGAYMREIKRIFRSHGLPEDLAYLPHVESSFNPKAFSKYGAAGMWQFTYETGKRYMTINYIVDERRDPLIAARAAARFLKRNHQQLGTWPLALTAYNYGTAGMKRAVKQEGSYERIFLNYRKGHFKFASRNFYAEFLAAVKVAKQYERSGLTLARPLSYVSVTLPAYADAAGLCRYLGISTGTLRAFNPALRDPVFQGTKYIPKNYRLKLPSSFSDSALLAAAPAAIFRAEQKRSRFYRVRAGDSAGAIAQAHKVSLRSLMEANNLDARAMIRVGQNLRIPVPGTAPAGPKQVAQAAPTAPVLRDAKKLPAAGGPEVAQPDFTVTGNLEVNDRRRTNNLLTGTIEVQPDESIRLYADWLKVTPASIRLANDLALDADVHPGQTIRLDFIHTPIETFETTRFDYHQEMQEDFFSSYAVVGITNYEVQHGDTIWELSRKKFDVPLWLLKKYNNELNFSRLELSSNLVVPVVKEI